MLSIAEILSQELGQKLSYIENVIALLDEGNTIPFIARYRKEMHGAMDDTTLRTLETRLNYLRNLQERKEEIIKAIEKMNISGYCYTQITDVEQEVNGLLLPDRTPKVALEEIAKRNK